MQKEYASIGVTTVHISDAVLLHNCPLGRISVQLWGTIEPRQFVISIDASRAGSVGETAVSGACIAGYVVQMGGFHNRSPMCKNLKKKPGKWSLLP